MATRQVAAKVNTKLAEIYKPVQIASDPGALALALLDVFKLTGPKDAQGQPYHQVSTNASTEIQTISGESRKYSFNEAFRQIAAAKGWDGDDADPVVTLRALEAENVVRSKWFSYRKASGGNFNVCKVWLHDPNYVKGQKAPKSITGDFGI
jgi:hypothetical protein